MMSLMIPRAAASAERIQEVLDTESSVVDTLTPKKAARGLYCASSFYLS
jgi:ABC-type multidrug transport system fused ATPase/permease subunit